MVISIIPIPPSVLAITGLQSSPGLLPPVARREYAVDLSVQNAIKSIFSKERKTAL
jgi:hypothetical protein